MAKVNSIDGKPRKAATKAARPLPPVSVIGLGKLGSPLAACYASMGCSVIGLDLDAYKVERIRRGHAPVSEPGLEELIQATGERLTATVEWDVAILGSRISFVIVPTPSEADGGFDPTYVIEACERIGGSLRMKDGYHMVVICSTVLPGTMDEEIRPALEAASGRTLGERLGLCYSPRFIALGTVIRDFLNPDMVLVGEADEHSGNELEEFYRRVHQNEPPIARMSFANAELAKLAVNTFVTTKISFANMLTELCEHLPGGDIDAVTSALGRDSRIGPKTLRGGLAYGGPCFPRDNKALAALGRKLGVSTAIADSTDEINETQASRIAALAQDHLRAGGKVSVLGLAYKPGTDVVEESAGMAVARELARRGARVTGFDPDAARNAEPAAKDADIELALTLEEAMASDVVVLVNQDRWDSELVHALNDGRTRMLIDCWRVADPSLLNETVTYVALGVGPRSAA